MSFIDEGYEDNLNEREVAALKLTDLIISSVAAPDEELIVELKTHFTEAQLVEMSLAVGLFLGMSKVLITLGLEPASMPVAVLPTPGS